jgi:hypothetical protein
VFFIMQFFSHFMGLGSVVVDYCAVCDLLWLVSAGYVCGILSLLYCVCVCVCVCVCFLCCYVFAELMHAEGSYQ